MEVNLYVPYNRGNKLSNHMVRWKERKKQQGGGRKVYLGDDWVQVIPETVMDGVTRFLLNQVFLVQRVHCISIFSIFWCYCDIQHSIGISNNNCIPKCRLIIRWEMMYTIDSNRKIIKRSFIFIKMGPNKFYTMKKVLIIGHGG